MKIETEHGYFWVRVGVHWKRNKTIGGGYHLSWHSSRHDGLRSYGQVQCGGHEPKCHPTRGLISTLLCWSWIERQRWLSWRHRCDVTAESKTGWKWMSRQLHKVNFARSKNTYPSGVCGREQYEFGWVGTPRVHQVVTCYGRTHWEGKDH